MEGDVLIEGLLESMDISIHSLRMEGDGIIAVSREVHFSFQSTPSVWRETVNKCCS